MSHIHSQDHFEEGQTVVVNSSHQINVMLMDDSAYQSFKRGRRFNYWGGFYTHFPAKITVPHTGYWNIVLSLPPGHRANIEYSINVL